MNNKFKAGDLIRLSNDYGMSAQKGATAIVQDPAYRVEWNEKSYLQVKWVRDDLCARQSDGSYDDVDFEPVHNTRRRKGTDTHPDGEMDDHGHFLVAYKDGEDFNLMGDEPFSTQREADAHANALAASEADVTVVVLKAVSQHSSQIVVSTEAV